MSNVNKPVLSLGYVDCEKVIRVTVQDGEATWIYDSTGTVETHDPLDLVGGPYRISDYVESDGGKWFLFWVVDCYFPLADLVRGGSFEDAYETYLDWAAERRHLAIDEPDLKDYLNDEGDEVEFEIVSIYAAMRPFERDLKVDVIAQEFIACLIPKVDRRIVFLRFRTSNKRLVRHVYFARVQSLSMNSQRRLPYFLPLG